MSTENIEGIEELAAAAKKVVNSATKRREELRRQQKAAEAKNAESLSSLAVAARATQQRYDDETSFRREELDQLDNVIDGTADEPEPEPQAPDEPEPKVVDHDDTPADNGKDDDKGDQPASKPEPEPEPEPQAPQQNRSRLRDRRHRRSYVLALMAVLATFIVVLAVWDGLIAPYAFGNGQWAQNGAVQFVIAALFAAGVGFLVYPDAPSEE